MPESPSAPKDLTRLSKTLSLALRHDPRQFGLALDGQGWTAIEAVLAALRRRFPAVTRAELEHLAAPSDKQRFEIRGDRIRATYGHSVPLAIDYPEAEPPPVLYHGTPWGFVDSILRQGLRPGRRRYVHLSETAERARQVGSRRDPTPAILRIDAARAHQDGLRFLRAADQTWLVAHLPPAYLAVSRDESGQESDARG
jgi:putative RNA 2'-phosphotransferase